MQDSLAKIADRKLPDADQKALQAVLQQTLVFIKNKEDSDKNLVELKQQLSQAPRQTTDNQRDLARLKASKVVPIAQRFANLDVAQLEQLLTDRSTQLADQQKA